MHLYRIIQSLNVECYIFGLCGGWRMEDGGRDFLLLFLHFLVQKFPRLSLEHCKRAGTELLERQEASSMKYFSFNKNRIKIKGRGF